ncbi:DUF6734 family protein [Mucilaginibacter sp. UYCu711]|uniref:DUF6734 family protein n=1 Tax=Mucilaginibacter sp. UYCu711 TaxID=3156339 RepID=UPI003D2535BC
MRIVQSFWSCKKSLIENSFGWFSPQYHIMSWALSCLKLKEHYPDLHLFTDKNGYDILINYLDLPYKKVNVCYDGINGYHENLWALPKILTYSFQDKPFIHVDGDVFIWKRFCAELELASLIAQNAERGTAYYTRLMTDIKKDLNYLPGFLEHALNETSITSYNAGIFGGTDLAFIKNFSDQAINLVNNNYGIKTKKMPSANFNILFEQILFAALCKKDKKKVTTLFSETFDDMGYATRKIADFTSASFGLDYIHVIGDKKRQEKICELLAGTLLKHYPDYFFKIIALFKNNHTHYEKKISIGLSQLLDTENNKESRQSNENNFFRSASSDHFINQPITKKENYTTMTETGFIHFTGLEEIGWYRENSDRINKSWLNIEYGKLHDLENYSTDWYSFFFVSKEQQIETVLKRHPYLEIVEPSFKWTNSIKKQINKNLVDEAGEHLGLAYIPQLFFTGIREIIIDEIDYNILTILEQPCTLFDILSQFTDCLEDTGDSNDQGIIYDIMLIKLKKLFLNRCIYIEPN